MRKRAFLGILILVATGLAQSAPVPAVVQRPGQWTLEVRFGQPEQIVLPYGFDGQMRYWYTILTITNRTGQDVAFYPKCEIMTDTFQIVPAGVGVPNEVFEKIKERHQSQYPLLEPLGKVQDRLFQGEDNARDIAVIWRDFDPRATGFKIFVSGLSNEAAVVTHPIALDLEGEPLRVYLSKTLELDYALRGDPALRSDLEVAYKGKTWVMR